MELKGTFQITDWKETTKEEFNAGEKLSTALVQQSYSGDITGDSKVSYQLYYNKSGIAVFNGFEVITANINNQQVLITIKHDGRFENGEASSDFIIVDSSNDNNLVGKIGTFKSIEGGKAKYQIS